VNNHLLFESHQPTADADPVDISNSIPVHEDQLGTISSMVGLEETVEMGSDKQMVDVYINPNYLSDYSPDINVRCSKYIQTNFQLTIKNYHIQVCV